MEDEKLSYQLLSAPISSWLTLLRNVINDARFTNISATAYPNWEIETGF
jgi:hypothetical protein